MLQHPRWIEPHHEFTILAADDLDPLNSGDPMETRSHVVERDIG